MVYNKSKKTYNQEYAKTHFKRIPLDVQKDFYERIRAAALQIGEPVNTFIKIAVQERIDRLQDSEK